MRLIDADVFRRELDNHWPFTKEEQNKHGFADMAKSTVLFVLNKMPTIEERKTGKWIDYTDEGYVECPFCHSATNCEGNKDELYYCFSCGARMESKLRDYENKGDDD